MSGGTRGVAATMSITSALGLVRVGANVELNFGGRQVVDGVFQPQEKETGPRFINDLASRMEPRLVSTKTFETTSAPMINSAARIASSRGAQPLSQSARRALARAR